MTIPITRNLIIANVLLFLAMSLLGNSGINLNEWLGLHFVYASNFNPLQLVTYMFMHANFTHLAFNMFSLWMFGRIIEHSLGHQRFLFFYLICGIGAGVCQEITQLVSYYVQHLDQYEMVNLGGQLLPLDFYLQTWTTVGASGSCYGILLAYGMLYPNERVMLLIPPIPMKAKYMVMGFIAIELVTALATPGDSMAHFAHLGGALTAWILIAYFRRKERRYEMGFTSWEEYNPQKKSIWQRIKSVFAHDKEVEIFNLDNEKKRNNEDVVTPEELNRILSKIKKSGYESLTSEEKEKLFGR